jgi:hypothetical protein
LTWLFLTPHINTSMTCLRPKLNTGSIIVSMIHLNSIWLTMLHLKKNRPTGAGYLDCKKTQPPRWLLLNPHERYQKFNQSFQHVFGCFTFRSMFHDSLVQSGFRVELIGPIQGWIGNNRPLYLNLSHDVTIVRTWQSTIHLIAAENMRPLHPHPFVAVIYPICDHTSIQSVRVMGCDSNKLSCIWTNICRPSKLIGRWR